MLGGESGGRHGPALPEKVQAEERDAGGKEGAAPAEEAGNMRFNRNLPEGYSVG